MLQVAAVQPWSPRGRCGGMLERRSTLDGQEDAAQRAPALAPLGAPAAVKPHNVLPMHACAVDVSLCKQYMLHRLGMAN
jgi:hypothetical protein